MSNLNDTEKALMNKLYVEYGLTKDHIFAHKFYKIITRAGIDKIQAKANIKVKFETDEVLSKITNGVVFQVFAQKLDENGKVIAELQTTGEANDQNCSQTYKVAMAEKRGNSRAVLKLAGLYEENVYSEDEADDFSKTVREQRKASTITYKGK